MNNPLPKHVHDALDSEGVDHVRCETVFRDGAHECTGRLVYVMKSGSRIFFGERVPAESPVERPRGLRVVK